MLERRIRSNITMNFKPQLSFDGVAIILAAIAFAVWLGSMKTTVDQIQGIVADHEQRIRKTEGEVIVLQHPPRIAPKSQAQPLP